jgi:DNA repair and recombination RAD54-like protein
MLQRQLHKKSLSGVVVDSHDSEDSRRFSVNDMKSLFSFTESKSTIHDSLNCKRCVNGVEIKLPPTDGNSSDLGSWNHAMSGKTNFLIKYKTFQKIFCEILVLKF